MKQFLKLTIILILGVIALGFQSCGSNEDEPPTPIDYNKIDNILGEWSCQAELKDGRESSCDEFTFNFLADKTVKAHYDFAYSRTGTYTFNQGCVTCTFSNSVLQSTAIVTMTFSEYNQGRAKVETTIDYGGSLPRVKHTYLFYKLK